MGTATSYRWEYGGATPSSGSFLSLRYSEVGNYPVTLTTTLSNGTPAIFKVTVQVVADPEGNISQILPTKPHSIHLFTPPELPAGVEAIHLQTSP